MSHLLDINGMAEKLIVLQHYAYGSKEYCRRLLIGSKHDAGDEMLNNYWGWTKGLVSNYLLECSIGLRVFLDTVAIKLEPNEIEELDTKARSGLAVGEVFLGSFELSVRESCNKIIHATKVSTLWETENIDDTDFKYWNGKVELQGTKGKKAWGLYLNVADWAKSMEYMTDQIDDISSYVSHDWY